MKPLILSLALLCYALLGYSQHERKQVDASPQYRTWQPEFILDKIEYTPELTIFYCRFVAQNNRSGGGMFSPPDDPYAFILKGRVPHKTTYTMHALRNLRRDGVLKAANVVHNSVVLGTNNRAGDSTVFTFEVHFKDLPLDLAEADLIEGKGQEFNTSNFNCFNIQLKTWPTDKPAKEPPAVAASPAPELPKSVQQASDLTCNEQLVLSGLQFHDNSTRFKGEVAARQTLHQLFDYLKAHPQTTVTLYGHTDVFGDADRNLELSKQRVYTVQRWLSSMGIAADRIENKWFGAQQPLYPEGNALNRRVEIRLHCP